MNVKIKRLRPNVIIPTKAHATDAGFDLYANTCSIDEYGNAVYGSGIAMEIPEGYVGLIFPRSSIANTDLLLSNSVGVIDSGYRGEIMAKFRLLEKYRPLYDIGERFAQIIIMSYPSIEFEEVESLSESDRGVGGYGSSGK